MAEGPRPVWALAPAAAFVVAMAGSIVLFDVQASNTLWLAACDRRTFIGCGLASLFFCVAAIVVATVFAGAFARRKAAPRSAWSAVRVGVVVAVCCLAGLFLVTVLTAGVMT
ncbi:hypothetical protein [Amycolatopsis sp. H20-H5]|uniref:hypothetical protein n=1 Tax=Amycolatopsis sp. H20-H5 TaxID=3046309 RepID=UPI002DB8604A|nr:hypothetical protein [Amycolatopsis sp. H20-H5]MEC3978454.1 hypothetical protein [Amycolatopsis sp. H20-H5]